jgi:hypothetical protein
VSKPTPLASHRALRVGLELFRARPCPEDRGPEGWPSREWEKRYLALRAKLIAGTPPPAEAVAAELFELQRQLRDVANRNDLPLDIAQSWEAAFASLGRAGDLVAAD